MPTNIEVIELGLYLLTLSGMCFFLMWTCKLMFEKLITRLLVSSVLCVCGLFTLLGFTITIGHLLGFWEMTK